MNYVTRILQQLKLEHILLTKVFIRNTHMQGIVIAMLNILCVKQNKLQLLCTNNLYYIFFTGICKTYDFILKPFSPLNLFSQATCFLCSQFFCYRTPCLFSTKQSNTFCEMTPFSLQTFFPPKFPIFSHPK